VAQALAVRVRFPAWSASVRSHHLSIVICRSSEIRCARLRTASTKLVRKRGLRGQLSVKRETASAFKPRTIGELMASHPASL
jgi:hypothetical protein